MVDKKTKRIGIVTIVLLFLVAIAYLSSVTIEHSGKTSIELSAFPDDSNITIDGENTKIGTHYLEPGTYKIEAEKEGYDNYSKTLVLEETKQKVVVILVPNSEEAFKFGRENEEEYLKVQAQGEVAAIETGKAFNQRNPIAKHLPYKTFFYSIGYRMDQSDPSGNSIIIEIDAIDGYRQSALYRIRQLGYDPTDFNINFRDYENPFSL